MQVAQTLVSCDLADKQLAQTFVQVASLSMRSESHPIQLAQKLMQLAQSSVQLELFLIQFESDLMQLVFRHVLQLFADRDMPQRPKKLQTS